MSHLTLCPDGSGNLKELLLQSDTDGLESLKVVGKMKAADWAYLSSNSGIISYVKELDLSEAEISYDGEVYGSLAESTGSMGVMHMEEYRFWQVDSVASRYTLDGTVWEYWGNNVAGAFKGTSYEKIILPKTLAGIGRNAFMDCKNLKEVVPGGNEKYVGEGAFYNSGALSKLELPASVDSIGFKAFYGAGNALTFDLSHVEKIVENAFEASGVSEVILSELISELPFRCFYQCNQLRSVEIGSGLKAIGGDAFGECVALESVLLPEGLERIETGAFSRCKSLSGCTLPESARIIGDGAFSGCEKLESINIPKGIEEMGGSAFKNTPFEKTLRSENGIVYIGHIAYDVSPDMPEDVEIKEGTKVLASQLFYLKNLNGDTSNERLKSVKLPLTLTHIGEYAFYDCKLQNITLPEGLEKIGNSSFKNVELENIKLPSSLKIIGDEAFYMTDASYEPKLREVVFPDGLEIIGTNAFGRHPLKSVTLPESLKLLGGGAFSDNNNLVSVDYKCRDAVSTGAPFWGSSCDKLTFYEGVESIPSSLFENATLGVQSLVIPEGVKRIGDKAFDEASSIKVLSLPTSLESIGNSTFYGVRIEELTLPENVKFIGDNAFGFNNCLKTVNFNCRHAVSRDEIVETQFGPERRLGVPFADSTCDSLVLGENVEFLMPYFMAGKWGAWKNIKTVDLSQVDVIGEHAFEYTLLESVVLPEKMDEIADGLFYECYALSSVRMPVSCRRIGNYAFSGCYPLNPGRLLTEDLEEIGELAFLRCKGSDYDAVRNRWESLVLPPTIRRVENRAFSGCSGVTTAFIPSTIEYLGKSSLAFAEDFGTIKKVIMMRETPFTDVGTPFSAEYDGIQSKWTAVVPEGCKSLYAACSGWSNLNIEENGTLTADPENVFNVNFGDLRIPEGGDGNGLVDTEGRIVGGVYYALPSPNVSDWEGEPAPVLSIWNGCNEEDAQKLHGARPDTHYIYDFFTGLGVLLPPVKGCIEMDTRLDSRQMNILIDGHDVTSITGSSERATHYINFDLSEPTLAWFYLSEQDNATGAHIFKLAVHPNQDVSGIETAVPEQETEVTDRYDITGRKVTGKGHGLVIEKYSDGSVRKVVR
ncbi:MAG: leucine-rich repeat protein [Muribaculaceae bacterium]|nr:leucine-rich repeat protein [Muribaculaceae bacterium]